MGDTADGTWGSRELGGFIRREDASRQWAATREIVHGTERPIAHAHHCRECGQLRACMTRDCAYRGSDLERKWVCVFCDTGESIT